MTVGSDRLHRRRCIGFRIAFIFGILLAVINRSDWTLLSIALVRHGDPLDRVLARLSKASAHSVTHTRVLAF